MRHNRSINHLGRKSGHRKSMLANMASSLILHKRINTTVAKAKALREYVEPLITKSKDDSTHSRRMVFSYLKQKEAVTELFRTVAPKIATRPGGYTRILKTGFRHGDAAEMAFIELVDFNEAVLAAAAPAPVAGEAAPKAEKKPATRRSRSKKTAEGTEAKKAAASAAPKAPKTTAKAPVKKAPRKTQGK